MSLSVLLKSKKILLNLKRMQGLKNETRIVINMKNVSYDKMLVTSTVITHTKSVGFLKINEKYGRRS